MNSRDNDIAFNSAKTLSEALPFIQRYRGEYVVVKFGGHAMADDMLCASFARDIVLLQHLGAFPIVVHGGGPQIGDMLERLNIQSAFKNGLRVTDAATMEVVEMVLSGAINKQIVRSINKAGGKAIGLSGSDGELIKAKKATKPYKDPESNLEAMLDLGFVGEPESVSIDVLHALTTHEKGFIPVVAPVGMSADGERYNINADTAAGAIAGKLNAKRLLLLTDIDGVLDAKGKLLTQIDRKEVERLTKEGTVSGGMIPKLETALDAIDDGVGAAVILNGTRPHALLMELFTNHGSGTLLH